ncbi:MAG TPA: sugar nucleotide-binding protein [Kiritimatiellia bacterium]|nr:sugar nucleotide-binding protein [Kiritimatiellia bacterium]
MKALVTGTHGTVGLVLADRLRDAGHHVLPWDRQQVSPEDPQAIQSFISRETPDAFFHLATGSLDWAETAARSCASLGIPFLYTSSVSVFSGTQRGPFTVATQPRPDDDYGAYKLEGEHRVRAAHPGAIVARLGWQIGETPHGNHMVAHLHRTAQTEGRIPASQNWFQACSFLSDTADSLIHLIESHPAGLYHIDGNPGLPFYDIVHGLNRMLGQSWIIEPSDHPLCNNLLLEDRLSTRHITAKFP